MTATLRLKACAATAFVLVGSLGLPANAATYEHLPFPTENAYGHHMPGPRGMSDDGRFIVYTGPTGAAAPLNQYPQTYLYDRVAKRTEVVSVPWNGGRGASGGSDAKDEWQTGSVSGDGRYVVFVSGAPNLVRNDRNASKDVFLRDRKARRTTRISVGHTGAEMSATRPGGGDQPFDAHVSRDGSRVLFHTAYDLLGDGGTGDTWFSWHRTTRRLTPITRRGGSKEGAPATVWGGSATMSRDGRYVVFSTATSLLGIDTDDQPDVYRRDVVTGALTLASDATVDAGAPAATPGQALPDVTAYEQATVDSTGRMVAFNALFVRAGSVAANRGSFEARLLVRNLASGAPKVLATVAEVRVTEIGSEALPPPRFDPVIAQDGSAVAYVRPRRYRTDVAEPPAGAEEVPTWWAPVLRRVTIASGAVVTLTDPGAYCPPSAPCYPDHPEQGEPLSDPGETVPSIKFVAVSRDARVVAFLTNLPVMPDDHDAGPDAFVWRA